MILSVGKVFKNKHQSFPGLKLFFNREARVIRWEWVSFLYLTSTIYEVLTSIIFQYIVYVKAIIYQVSWYLRKVITKYNQASHSWFLLYVWSILLWNIIIVNELFERVMTKLKHLHYIRFAFLIVIKAVFFTNFMGKKQKNNN